VTEFTREAILRQAELEAVANRLVWARAHLEDFAAARRFGGDAPASLAGAVRELTDATENLLKALTGGEDDISHLFPEIDPEHSDPFEGARE
jgi:hypothetical protein